MKNYFLLLILMLSTLLNAQDVKVDPVAIQILDHMSDVIGQLNSCAYTLSTSQDINDPENGMIKSLAESKVVMVGPDKMLIKVNGDKGNKEFWYDGTSVTYYSFTENNYAKIDAPDNIIATIDSVSMKYDIEIPAADFFYPAFTDDILAGFDRVKYLGEKVVDNEACFHIKTIGKDMDVQYWISNDAYNLPKKYLIVYKDRQNMQYEGTFSNWEINPDIPEAVFEFTAPPKAREIKILAKK